MTNTVETLLNQQLAACLAAMQDCLSHSRAENDDPYGNRRRHDVAYMGKLMKASARLTEALAKLKGETRQTIHVTRGGESRSAKDKDADKGRG